MKWMIFNWLLSINDYIKRSQLLEHERYMIAACSKDQKESLLKCIYHISGSDHFWICFTACASPCILGVPVLKNCSSVKWRWTGYQTGLKINYIHQSLPMSQFHVNLRIFCIFIKIIKVLVFTIKCTGGSHCGLIPNSLSNRPA